VNAKVERKDRSHQAILASAGKLLRERGVAGASVGEVMKGAGLTVGGFYAHFGSKEQLIDETLRRTAAAMRERLFARLEDKPERERVEVVLKRYLSAAHRDTGADGCMLPAVTGEIGSTAPAHREVLSEQVDAMAKALARHVHVAEGISARQVALGTVALMYGGLSLARASAGTGLSDEMLRACRAFGRLALLALHANSSKSDRSKS
jgi:TetR/AcrR family transcriptional regulator, transcriptional repressor for nem operon